MKTFPLDLALSFSLFMQCMWILLRKRPSRLVFSDTEGSLLGLGQQSPPSIPFPQAQMDANPSCTVKSRGNSLPFHVCACSSFPAASSNAFSSEFAHGIRNTEWRTEARLEGAKEGGKEGEREETRKEEERELARCTFGGRAGEWVQRLGLGAKWARRPRLPNSASLWVDRPTERGAGSGGRRGAYRRVAWCDKVERNSNFASSSCRMRNAQLFLKVQRAWPSSSTVPLFIHSCPES